ncbi:MAG: 4Fe-4S dicluster domain-containing protein [Gammaproteobacteria bacterium]|nr:4Fe-4S dicluster domain-containing protein [Gammaproteobacteria bacterium]
MSGNVKKHDSSRREFLGKATGAAATIAIAPGVMLHSIARAQELSEGASSENRWGMLIDSNKCAADCDDCVKACHTENGVSTHDRPLTDPQWIRKVDLKDTLTGKTTSLPVMCQHCEEPPCVDVCPTGASMKRADGIVLVDKHICIGCRYCMMACPYKARSFVHEAIADQKEHAPRGKGTVESCTLCVHRVDAGRTTACAEACSKAGHDAITFGNLNDPNSEISKQLSKYNSTQIRADLGLNTGVRYRGI